MPCAKIFRARNTRLQRKNPIGSSSNSMLSMGCIYITSFLGIVERTASNRSYCIANMHKEHWKVFLRRKTEIRKGSPPGTRPGGLKLQTSEAGYSNRGRTSPQAFMRRQKHIPAKIHFWARTPSWCASFAEALPSPDSRRLSAFFVRHTPLKRHATPNVVSTNNTMLTGVIVMEFLLSRSHSPVFEKEQLPTNHREKWLQESEMLCFFGFS
ncbi:MAG: hypothetical protein Greene101449_1316 [Candidatus Peregrinibacteria bacterium Greene1014_49]|nr:MAG: hypothetical protein Greene101449_1316 [Candidatus Peregrinibacteria bacterium Greene1014_49]